jgi:ribosome-associated protein
MSKETRQQVAEAVKAIESKKGEDLVILEMDLDSGAFTDYFVLVSGTNPRQVQAICDEVEKHLASLGVRPSSIEGFNQAEWVLLDYVDFVVHIFSEKAREFYDLERLWTSARRITPADLKKQPAPRKPAPKLKAAARTATSRRPKARSKAGPKGRKTGTARKPAAKRVSGMKARPKAGKTRPKNKNR